VIRFESFSKSFGVQRAVSDLTLEIVPGEIVSVLGPNGSGKTTSLKAAAGLLHPTSGAVFVGGRGERASEPSARRALSFLPQKVSFPESLSGREVLDFYRALRGVARGRVDEALKMASLNGAASRAVGTYSGGMTQRLGLAVAALPDTPVLLLDEPTAALDPDGLCAFYGLAEARRREGKTVLFTSHQLGDVERLADRVAVLVAGKLAALLTQRELADRLAARGVMRLRLETRLPGLLERLRPLAPAAAWSGEELIVPGPARHRPAVLDAVRAEGATIVDLMASDGRLEDLYRELVGGTP
jgi:Cu-processing system ATP-binding protein